MVDKSSIDFLFSVFLAICLELSTTDTMSVESLLALKPHWLSGWFSSAMIGTSLLSKTLACPFSAMGSRVIPR